MNSKKFAVSAAALLVGSSFGAAKAATDFVVEASPTWTRPASSAQASSSLTTYQAWNDFDSTQTAGPAYQNPANDPASVNPNGTAAAWDAAYPADGAFFIGSGTYQDIYSFGASLNPEVTVPEFSVTGQHLNVTAQVQYYGSDIDLNDLTVTYTDASGVQQRVLADTLPNYSVTNLYSALSDVGFGEADLADYEWTFSVPNTSNLQLSWGWDVTSSALQDIAVDTQSVAGAVPEPASACVAAAAGLLLLGRRRRVIG